MPLSHLKETEAASTATHPVPETPPSSDSAGKQRPVTDTPFDRVLNLGDKHLAGALAVIAFAGGVTGALWSDYKSREVVGAALKNPFIKVSVQWQDKAVPLDSKTPATLVTALKTTRHIKSVEMTLDGAGAICKATLTPRALGEMLEKQPEVKKPSAKELAKAERASIRIMGKACGWSEQEMDAREALLKANKPAKKSSPKRSVTPKARKHSDAATIPDDSTPTAIPDYRIKTAGATLDPITVEPTSVRYRV